MRRTNANRLENPAGKGGGRVDYVDDSEDCGVDLTAEEFEAHVAANAKPDLDLNYAIIGLNEEAGETAGWHKKFNLRGNPTGKFTPEDLKGELGDVLYYATRAANLMGWTLSDVMDTNKQKLDKRKGKGLRIIV